MWFPRKNTPRPAPDKVLKEEDPAMHTTEHGPYNGILILTLTINPAIDRNVTADRLVFEDRAYILSTNESAGGRGINASSVIHSFGGKTLAILTSGGASGKRLEELVRAYGFPVEVAP